MLTGYDEWKTTEPRDYTREREEAEREALEEAEEALDAALDFASLCASLGLEGEAEDPWAVYEREVCKARYVRGLEA